MYFDTFIYQIVIFFTLKVILQECGAVGKRILVGTMNCLSVGKSGPSKTWYDRKLAGE